MVKPNFLHGKLYHVRQESGIEKAIAGSSNFTVNGLGLGGNKNIELNLVVDSDRDRQELREWFDAIWNDLTGLVEDVKDRVIEYLQQLYIENDPEFIYFKTLFHIFENYLDEQKKGGLLDERTGFFASEVWHMLYDFQKDGQVRTMR
jgi:phosphatidylserine/phosphatidylglycerophosphate/cardiolipin synthase-like enzyme